MKYLVHQACISKTQLQYGIRYEEYIRVCIYSDAVCDLMRLFVAEGDDSSTFARWMRKIEGRVVSSFRKTNSQDRESGQMYWDGNRRL